jgi:hypothetical protein
VTEDSIHIIRSNTLNIPSEREQKRDAVRSYTEDNPDTPGTRRPVSPVVLGGSERYSARGCAPGSRAPSGGSPGTQARIQRSLQPTPRGLNRLKFRPVPTPAETEGTRTRRAHTVNPMTDATVLVEPEGALRCRG